MAFAQVCFTADVLQSVLEAGSYTFRNRHKAQYSDAFMYDFIES